MPCDDSVLICIQFGYRQILNHLASSFNQIRQCFNFFFVSFGTILPRIFF